MSFKVWLLVRLFKSMGFSVCLVAEDPLTARRALLFAHTKEMAEGLAYRVLADYMLDHPDPVVPKTKRGAQSMRMH